VDLCLETGDTFFYNRTLNNFDFPELDGPTKLTLKLEGIRFYLGMYSSVGTI